PISLPPLPGDRAPVASPARSASLPTVVVVALASALLAALLTAGLLQVFDRDSGQRGTARSTLESGAALDIQTLLRKAQPSVVTVHTDTASSSGLYGGAGTGVVVGEDGYILTNWHVIGGASSVRVTLHDGTEHEATLVGGFPNDDIALIRVVDGPSLVPAELGSSSSIQVGDEVVAIGNALNLGGTPSVTRGIVSATDRTIQTPEITLRGLIQTDAAINPGNSGGPLLDVQGRVIGINTAIISDAQNIGFAIPIDAVKPLIDELKQGRGMITPSSAFLGVVTESVNSVPDAVLDQYDVSASNGALITEVQPGTAADRSGLRIGDVITRIDGQRVRSREDVLAIIRSHDAGDEITVEIERAGRKTEITVELGSRLGGN
ncbi:S1C family serine protease, partial [Rhabdothermincola sp.]|uniref:S1C family serine protease n=1 Tax=Rhabdothermincola sp. TaxID=2820405 RepID=UPI002FDFE4D5